MTDYKIEYQLGLQEFEAALREVKGFPVDRLPKSCELWVDYRLESGQNKAEKLFVDHDRRRVTPKEPVHRAGSLMDDGSWQDEEVTVRQRKHYYTISYVRYIDVVYKNFCMSKRTGNSLLVTLAMRNSLHMQKKMPLQLSPGLLRVIFSLCLLKL